MQELLDRSPGNQNKHYRGNIQPIVFAMSWDLNLAFANVIKYLNRFERKNGLEDIQKAYWYIEIIKENYRHPLYKRILFYFGLIKEGIPVEDFIADQNFDNSAARIVYDLMAYWQLGIPVFLETAMANTKALLETKEEEYVSQR